MELRKDKADWRQGEFIDGPRYAKQSEAWKEQQRMAETYMVRPGPTGNALCRATSSDAAAFIVERLNRAAELEQAIMSGTSAKALRDMVSGVEDETTTF